MTKTYLKNYTFALVLLALGACEGTPGNNGVDGTSCTVTDNGDGSKTIRCADGTTAVIYDGNNGFSGATGATGAAGDTGEAGEDGENGDDGEDGMDCSVTQNADGTATITCDDGSTAIVGVPTTTAADAGTANSGADAGMTEVMADAGAIEDTNDAGAFEEMGDAGMAESAADAGAVDEAADGGTEEPVADAGTGAPVEGYTVTYGFEAEDSDGPAVNPATYDVGDDVWAVVSSLESVSSPSEGSNFWGMQDLENNNGGNSGYHTLTFGPYDVSGFDEGSISFDYFTVNYLVGTDKIGYVLLIDGQSAPNLAADDSSLTFLSESTGGVWTSVSASFEASATSVTLIVAADQNGADDYAGVDNFQISCTSCTTHRDCGDNATAVAAGTTSSDTVCECDTGYFGNGTSCAMHTACDANASETTPGTSTTDAECECNTGYFGDGTSCAMHTACDANATETTPGTSTADAACECNTGYFGDGTSCAMHTACDANATETTPGTSTADAACECNTGYFGDGASCTMHTACDANATEITPGTSTTDAACECNTGYFGDGAGCDPTKNLGEACTDNAECTSGICDNSVCAPVPPMHLGASGCTYTSYVLSDGTLLCGTNDKTAKYYTNGTGTALSADLDLDGTPDVEYRSGGTWTTWASDLGSSTPTFAENPANGDIYYTQLLFDGGVTTTIWKSEGGVLGTKSEFATGLDVEVFDSGITSDTTYLYARTGVDEVTRYEMATGTSTVIATSGIPSADSMAVGDQYLYISTEYQIFRVDKVNGGAGEVIAGTGVAGANYAADGVDATTVAITIPSKSVASVVQGRVYFVDQSGYTGGKVRYVTPDGMLETVEEIESSINQGVFVRGDLAYAKTYQIAAPIAP